MRPEAQTSSKKSTPGAELGAGSGLFSQSTGFASEKLAEQLCVFRYLAFDGYLLRGQQNELLISRTATHLLSVPTCKLLGETGILENECLLP